MDATKILPDEIFDRIGNELEDDKVVTTPQVAKQYIKRCMYHDVVEHKDDYDNDCMYQEILEYVDDINTCDAAINAGEEEITLEYHPMAANGLVVRRITNV